MKGFFKEFGTFATRGNAVNLAAGVVIGAAFNQVTTALTEDILTPPVGLLLAGARFSELSFRLNNGIIISYGHFLQTILNFVLIMLALFLLVKLFTSLERRRTGKSRNLDDNPHLEALLEIRDELRARRS